MACAAAIFISSLMLARLDVERAAEDAGEGQRVVDLVRVVGAAGGDRQRAGFPRQVGRDLRHRVGQREDDRVRGHRADHLRGQRAAGREADEDVGAGDDLAERARAPLAVGQPAISSFEKSMCSVRPS